MSRKLIFGLVWIALIVTACQALPTPSPTTPPTRTLSPTLINTPTPSATPTLTPYPPLAEQGPYLMYAQKIYTKGHGLPNGPYTIVDANLRGRKTVDVPDDVYIHDLKHAVSPDGKWLAFHAGSTKTPYNLTLNLLSIPDGTIHPITKLFSSTYPKDLGPVADFYEKQGLLQVEPEYVISQTITGFAWSPDGKYLAFAGQMDGPSSDLYIYDLQTGTIRRLTDDLYILNGGITWSPNGKWLLTTDTTLQMDYASSMLHRIKADGATVQNPPILEQGWGRFGIDWISPSAYLMATQGDGGEPHNLRYLDVETGKIYELWESMYFSYAINPQDMTIAINGLVSKISDDPLVGGNFVVSLDGKRTPLSHEANWMMGFMGGENPFFLGISDKNLIVFDNAGTVKVEQEFEYRRKMLPSPDNKWFVLFDEQGGNKSLVLFSADRKQKKEFSDLDAKWVLWRGDSLGFFVAGSHMLYYIALSDTNPVLVDQCLPDEAGCYFSDELVWLP